MPCKLSRTHGDVSTDEQALTVAERALAEAPLLALRPPPSGERAASRALYASCGITRSASRRMPASVVSWLMPGKRAQAPMSVIPASR
jgi:hypothetical protein